MSYFIDYKKSIEVLIKNSLGSKFFRSVYFNVYGKTKDILENGNLSCAFYVSIILKIVGLISNVHSTVLGTVNDLEKNGWYLINQPKKYALIVWDKDKKHKNLHIGFCLNKIWAVSNSSKFKTPIKHKINYENRIIKAIYFHPSLE
jgi:hypothetical protein